MGTTDVLIFDTTLRDGEQAPGNSLTPEEKIRLARQLDALGVDIIEAGFPAASEGDYRSVREIAAEVRRPVVAALARCTEGDIDLAGEALSGAERGRIHVFRHLRDWGSLLPPDPVPAQIQRDAIQPRRKLRLPFEAGQRPVRTEERILTDVARVLFATENARSRYNHSGLGAYPPISRQNSWSM